MDNGNTVLSSKNHIVSGISGLFEMEPEVSMRLHSGSSWLSVVIVFIVPGHFSFLRNFVTVFDSDSEINIGVKWDWFATEGCLGECSTPCKVSWAMKSSFLSFLQLWEGKIPAFEYFASTDGESL